MRNTALGLAIVLSLFVVPNRGDAQTAKEIIQKAIQAHGGLENLKKYPGARGKMKGEMTVKNLKIGFEAESVYFFPDLFKNVMKMEVGGQKATVEEIGNGNKLKITVNGAVTPINDKKKAELFTSHYLQRVIYLYPLLDEKVFELSVIDKPEKVGGKEVVGVLIKSKGRNDAKVFFDAKTFEIVKMERKGLDPADNEVDQTMVVLENKKFDGILHGVKVEIFNDGKRFMTYEMTEIKHLDKVDKKEFDVSD